MIDIYQLKNFCAFAKCGTLTRAAEMLNTSQPALTRSMASLEHEIGVPLFNRAKNKISLNGNGRLALTYAEKILAQVDEMKNRVVENDKTKRTILVGAIAPAPIWILQEEENALKFFGEKNIGRKIEFEIADEERLFKGIESRKYEFIVLPYSVKHSENQNHVQHFSSQKICDEHLCFSLPLTHRFANRKRLSFADMNGENFLVASKIGFWNEIHKSHLPDSNFFIQNDKFTFEELTQNSTLPHFVTDLSLKHLKRPIKNKVIIPISDKAAHAEFFLWKRK